MSWEPEHRKQIAKLLRWLADEVEADRVAGDIEIEIDAEPRQKPRSWFDGHKAPEYEIVQHGAKWKLRCFSTKVPP